MSYASGRSIVTWDQYLRPSAAKFESISRLFINSATTALTSGTLRVAAISLPRSLVVTSISFMSGTTALTAGTSTHQIFGLYNSSKVRLAVTSDDGQTAWGASTVKTLNLTTPYTTTYEGLHYLACMVNADTGNGGVMPTFNGWNGVLALVAGVTPQLFGNTSDTGLTTTLPDPFGTITNGAPIYCYVS
jgi:hypothetical protein